MGGVVAVDITPFILAEVEKVFNLKAQHIVPVMDTYIGDLQKDYTDEITYWKKVTHALGVSVPEKQMHTLWSESHTKHAHINPEMVQLIHHLKKKYKIGLITNTINSHYNYAIQQGWYDLFDVAIISNIVKHRKPEPEIYELALTQLQVKPSEAVFIDDVKEFLEPAQKLGMHTIQFVSLEQLMQDLKKMKIA